jgi:transposase-like protein
MERKLPVDWATVAKELGESHPAVRLSAGDPESDYTTNAIESINMSLRKVTKSRASFPTDDAVLKLFYLALNNISKKWTLPISDWTGAPNRFSIQFEDRLLQE